MCVLRPCRQKGAQSLGCESLDLWLSLASHTLRTTILLECLDSDAARSECCRGSPMAQPATETLANTHRSLGTSPRQDYTQNDCVSACWSRMYQYFALTSLRDSHPLPARHIREPIGGFSSHFRISVSVLPFPYFSFCFSVFHLP